MVRAAELVSPHPAPRRIKQALAIKADSWEATGSMAQLEWERLKAKLGYIVPAAQ